jgi:hypothetical protein
MPLYALVDGPEDPVQVGELRARLPATVRVDAAADDADPLPASVYLHINLSNGSLVCTGCEVRAADVTTEVLRRIPVGRWAREAVQALRLVEDTAGPLPTTIEGGISAPTLASVARVYRWAAAVGDAPFGLLERKYGIPRAKASRWVSIAKRRGLL